MMITLLIEAILPGWILPLIIISEQKSRLDSLENECAKSDQYSRRSTVVLSGLTSQKTESPDSLKSSVCNVLSDTSGVTVKQRDLQACHRNGKPSDPSKPPSVTVRFFDFNLNVALSFVTAVQHEGIFVHLAFLTLRRGNSQ